MISYEIRKPGSNLTPAGVVKQIGVGIQHVRERMLAERAMRAARALLEAENDPVPPRFTNPGGTPGWIPAAQRQQQQQFPSAPGATAMMMGKLCYAKWLEEEVVKKGFEKGRIVTLRSMPYVPGRAPNVLFKVVEVQEIHYMAQIDRESREPKTIGINVLIGAKDHIPVWYPPCRLRVLQPEEVNATNDLLRNQAPNNGSADTAGKGEAGPSEDGYAERTLGDNEKFAG